MNYTYFGKKAGLNRTKDLVILCVCVALYVLFFLFMLTPPGNAFFDFVKKSMPFMNLIDGTLSDINRFFGLVFEKIGLGQTTNSVTDEIGGLSFVALLIDLSKLMVASVAQSLLFTLFSLFFLNGKNSALADVFLGFSDLDVSGFADDIQNSILFKFQKKKDILYAVNSALLMGISILVGGLAANSILHFVSIQILEFDIINQLCISLFIFVVIYILFSLLFMFRTIKSAGVSYSFRRSVIKTFLFNLLPESLVFFVTNVIIVLTFNCFVTKGFHIFSLFALLLFIAWSWLSDKIEGFLREVFHMKIPFMGQHCPFTGLLWLPSTVTLVSMLYIMMVPNMDANSSILEQFMTTLPFLREWVVGAPVFTMLITDPGTYITSFLYLLGIFTFAAMLQYFSSSYVATLTLQVIVRWLIMGVYFLLFIGIYAVLVFCLKPAVDAVEYKSIAILLGILLYFIFATYQPFLALQGFFSTVLAILLMQWLPGTLIGISVGSDATFGRFIGGAVTVIGVNLLLSLLQNIAAVLEKKAMRLVDFLN